MGLQDKIHALAEDTAATAEEPEGTMSDDQGPDGVGTDTQRAEDLPEAGETVNDAPSD